MRKLITLILFALFTTIGSAQNYQDVVYLKNGSVIRGVIIEQVPNESIKIETTDRSVFVYRMDEIEKMTKENKLVTRSNHQDFEGGGGLKSGYRGIMEIGYQFGVGDYGMDRLKFNIINGGQFNPYFYLGGGIGLRYYFDAEAAVVPIFIHPRVNFIDAKVSPYLALSLGYALNATNDFEGLGLLLSPSMGVTFNVSQKVNLNVGVSYEMQDMDFYYYNYYGYSYRKENSGALSVDFGLSF